MKVERFEEHYVALDEAFEGFEESNPYELVCEIRNGGLEAEWRVTNVKPLPERLQSCVGCRIVV